MVAPVVRGPGPGLGDAEALKELLARIYRQEMALACQLADGAREGTRRPNGRRETRHDAWNLSEKSPQTCLSHFSTRLKW